MSPQHAMVVKKPQAQGKSCLSCGLDMDSTRRRYCSKDCKEDLFFALRWLTSLLIPLNTRHATFSFTDEILMVNVLPYGGHQVITYVYVRKPACSPARDLKRMYMALSQEWQAEKKRTRKAYLASRHVLAQGRQGLIQKEDLKPKVKISTPAISKKLTLLKISLEDLRFTPEDSQLIKSAFRKAAKQYHPDAGGNNVRFRKIFEAYEQILEWLKDPSDIAPVITGRGVPGKWSYSGDTRRWSTPL